MVSMKMQLFTPTSECLYFAQYRYSPLHTKGEGLRSILLGGKGFYVKGKRKRGKCERERKKERRGK
jgi:hypothetical protein